VLKPFNCLKCLSNQHQTHCPPPHFNLPHVPIPQRTEFRPLIKRAWKLCLIWIGFIVTITHAEIGLADSCVSYGKSRISCFCRDASRTTSASRNWHVGVSYANGEPALIDDLNVGYCADGSDTLCVESRPTRLEDGTTLFLKNNSSSAPDFFHCEITYKKSMVAESYTPNIRHLDLAFEGDASDTFLSHIKEFEDHYPYMFLMDLTTLSKDETNFLVWKPEVCNSPFKLTEDMTCIAMFETTFNWLWMMVGVGGVLIVLMGISGGVFYGRQRQNQQPQQISHKKTHHKQPSHKQTNQTKRKHVYRGSKSH